MRDPKLAHILVNILKMMKGNKETKEIAKK